MGKYQEESLESLRLNPQDPITQGAQSKKEEKPVDSYGVRVLGAEEARLLREKGMHRQVEEYAHRQLELPFYCDHDSEDAHTRDCLTKKKEVIPPKKPKEYDTINPKDLVSYQKPPLFLIPPSSLVHCAMAMSNGADKYGPYNWREIGVHGSVYIGAAMRHLLAWYDGEEDAEDSGVHHLGHAMACMAILLDCIELGNIRDDRPKPGVTAKLLKKYTKDG